MRANEEFDRRTGSPSQMKIAYEHPSVTLMKKREKGLYDLFRFYSRQHIIHGRKMNFDEFEKEANTIN